MFKILVVNGYVYELKPGEEKKLNQAAGNSGTIWLEVEASQDYLSGALAGEHIQLSNIVAWQELPDEPAADPA